MRFRSFPSVFFLLVTVSLSCQHAVTDKGRPPQWCARPERPGLEKLKELKTHHSWFRVFSVAEGVYAFMEPYQSQEVLSYLILGKDSALLFDTGMGLDHISYLVKDLTKLPVLVLNSHTHPDHIGGNSEFPEVLAMSTEYTDANARDGYSHEGMRIEITPENFCSDSLPRFDSAAYRIKPFRITRHIADGDFLDLGGRTLKILATPGHTPDAIALLDSTAGLLWTGDSFYLGPVWLFMDGTDLNAYDRSISRMAALSPSLKQVLPAHNLPVADPASLVAASALFKRILNGTAEGKDKGEEAILFEGNGFSYLVGKKLLGK